MNSSKNLDIKEYVTLWNQLHEQGKKEMTLVSASISGLNALNQQGKAVDQNNSEELKKLMDKCESGFAVLNGILEKLNNIVILSGDAYKSEKNQIYESQADDEDNYSKLNKLEKFMTAVESAYQVSESCVKSLVYGAKPEQIKLIVARWDLSCLNEQLYQETFEDQDLQF